MSVLTLFMCIALSVILVFGRSPRYKLEARYLQQGNTNKYLETISRTREPGTEIYKTLNIASTEPYKGPTTDNGAHSTETTESPHENSTEICLPGQSAYNKKDLVSIINAFYDHHKMEKKLNDSYYLKALRVRDKYTEDLKMFEKRFEDRPQHLKHILQDMVVARQRIEPMAKRIAALLEQFQSYENSSYRTTEGKVKKVLEHIEKSKKICNLNCGDDTLENIITMTSLRRFLTANQIYCSTFGELSKIIMNRLTKFQTEFRGILENKITKDTTIFEDKIKNIKNKLKTAAVEQFGLTMYEILNLQDEYYHLAMDLKDYNISYVLQDIKQNEYEINSKLLKLESNSKLYRDYCISCNDRLVYTVSSTSELLARTVVFESESLLDEVLIETTNNIQISINEKYTKIFEDLNKKLDETTIIEAHLRKLKPIKGEIDKEVQKQIGIFENLQSLVPKTSIKKVFKLADESKELLQSVENGLIFTRKYIFSEPKL